MYKRGYHSKIAQLKNRFGDDNPENAKELARAAGKALLAQNGFSITKIFKTSERKRVYQRGYQKKKTELKNRFGDYNPENMRELARAAGNALLAQNGFSITETFKTSERNRVYTRGYCRKIAELKK